MRVLWFTNIPLTTTSGYNGGGWMYSLRDEILKEKAVELGVAYYSEEIQPVEKIDNCSYFYIQYDRRLLAKIKRRIFSKPIVEEHIDAYVKIVNNFKPDIIHIFGTEKPFGLIANRVNIPVVIHIQSVLNSYLNAYFPPGINMRSFIGLNIRENIKQRNRYREFKIAALREVEIFKTCTSYMGRTPWDHACIDTLASAYTYHHIDETLRGGFYETSDTYVKEYGNEIKIISVISDPLYKGIDLVVKTAEILLLNNVKYTWSIIGNISKRNIFLVNKDLKRLNIILCGVLNENELIAKLKDSTVYVHPSYIEGSCNSVAEAQMLGLPSIACDVGGVSYISQDMVSGMLVPSNDVYQLAYRIKLLHNDDELYRNLSKNGLAFAKARHNKQRILSRVLSTYEELITTYKAPFFGSSRISGERCIDLEEEVVGIPVSEGQTFD